MKKIAVVGGGLTRFWMEASKAGASKIDNVNNTWEIDNKKFIYIDSEMSFRGFLFDNLITYKYTSNQEDQWVLQIKAQIEFTESDWNLNGN